jgi:hypothetical protein
LTHIKQYESGETENLHLHFASKNENEANALAGELVNAFSVVIGYDTIYEAKR